jgi:hypothetical protein
MYAQTAGQGEAAMSGFFLVAGIAGLVFGLIAGFVRQSQGGKFSNGFAWGFLLGIIGLIVVATTANNLNIGGKKPPKGSTDGQLRDPAAVASTIAWVKSGQRYLLGYTMGGEQSFGIWDRENMGPPVYRFPYTDFGKSEANERYAQLEPNSVPSAAPAAPAVAPSNAFGF